MRVCRQRGFTLVELMVVVTIVTILVAIGFPSFQASLRASRLATSSNELLASVALARSEAVRSVRGSGICASRDGTTCSGDWNNGWLVWQEVAGSSPTAFNPGADVVVRRIEAPRGMTVALTGTSGGALAATAFDSRGRPVTSAAPLTWSLTPDKCPAGQALVRHVRVSFVGQAKLTRENCP